MASNRRVASGQITIVDLNDGKAIQAYTIIGQGKTQIYNPDTKVYTPNYTVAANNQTVTAKILVTGSGTDQAPTAACSGWAWKVNGTAATATGDISFNKNVLTIKKNIDPSVKFFNVEWSCNYTDSDTGAVTPVQGADTISLSSSGGATGLVIIDLPKGDTFDEGNALTTLTAEARLYRGSTLDTTIKNAAWERLDISTGNWVAVTSGVDALSGGMSKLTVQANDVLNFQGYRVKMTDQETNEVFTGYVTFLDATDPYIVYVRSNTGDKIVNGSGSTEIYAEVWRDGTVVETKGAASPKFNYTWTKYNRSGVATNWSGTTSTTKTGNPITVLADDVDVRATIYCEVTEK